tara:strand:+ start:768 stop:1565 length:798 start_codon:yes stop_codon:yes gene_type:complete
MSTRTTIKKILLENNKRYNKFAYNVIRYAYDNIRNDHKKRGTESKFKSKFGSVDNWIRDIKTHFFDPFETQKPQYSLDKIIDYYDNPLIEGIQKKDIIRILSEFILNFEGSDERIEVDVIEEYYFEGYIRENYFKCTKEFFEFVWDVYLKDVRNHWNENPKDNYWEEIKDDVIEKMEDVEWQEENGVSFDRLNNEKEYFMSYWHYPMDSLGWDRDDLCEFYKDMLSAMGDEKLKQVIMFHDNQFVNSHLIGDELYYIIDKDKFLF